MAEIRESVAKSDRRLAQHDYIGATGQVVDKPELATGVRYTSKAGFTRDWNLPNLTPGTPESLMAVFGIKTKQTNTTSGARQREESEDEALDQIWSLLGQGVWRERAEGLARGPKYDLQVLGQAMIDTAENPASVKGDAAFYAEKLKADKSLYSKVRARPAIMARYYELVGKESEGSDSLL